MDLAEFPAHIIATMELPPLIMCAGYRPILDAMTTFQVENGEGVVDIEVNNIYSSCTQDMNEVFL